MRWGILLKWFVLQNYLERCYKSRYLLFFSFKKTYIRTDICFFLLDKKFRNNNSYLIFGFFIHVKKLLKGYIYFHLTYFIEPVLKDASLCSSKAAILSCCLRIVSAKAFSFASRLSGNI